MRRLCGGCGGRSDEFTDVPHQDAPDVDAGSTHELVQDGAECVAMRPIHEYEGVRLPVPQILNKL
jgi:hypothetical protein